MTRTPSQATGQADDAAGRPLPGCPARHGDGADVTTAGFILVVDDCERGPDRQPTATEIFGYFRVPGREHDDDVVLTADLTVPVASPIARLARKVSDDLTGALSRVVGDVLRGNVARCPCAPTTSQCPALDELRLVEALECAASQPLGRATPRRRPGPGW